MLELTHDELDLVVMGQVMAGCFSGEMSSHRRRPVLHHVLPQRHEDMPEDFPLPPRHMTGKSSCFSTFCTMVKGIKKLHHLRFNLTSLGFVYVKEKAGSIEVKKSIPRTGHPR